MKMYIYIVVLILKSSFLFSQPKIEIEGGTNLDFGEIPSGSKVDKKVIIKNTGKDTLKIESVQASCGCTAALLSENNIPPKGTGSLNIGFDSKGFDGKIYKTVTVKSNDTTKPQLQIVFSANVKSLLKFEPQMVYFQNLHLDTTASMTVKVKNNSEEPVEILSFENKILGLKIDIMQRKLMPNETTEMLLKYIPSSQGMVQSEIIVNTKSKKHPRIPLRFFAFVR